MNDKNPTNAGPLTPEEIGLRPDEMADAQAMMRKLGDTGDPPCTTPIEAAIADAHQPELTPLEVDPNHTPVSHYAGENADLIGAKNPADIALAKIERIKRKLGAALALHVEVQQALADQALLVQLTAEDVASVRKEQGLLADQIDALSGAVRAHEASLAATHKAATALRAGFNVNQTGLDPVTFNRMAGVQHRGDA